MTPERIEPDGSMSLWLFLVPAFGVVAGIMAIIWYGIPGPDNEHRFVSPSGKYALELAELCGEFTCDRIAIYEETITSNEKIRLGCDINVEDDHPVFVSITPVWSTDEKKMSVGYSDGEAVSAILQIDFAQSCHTDS